MYRINELLNSERRLFHTNDLAILWGIKNRNTLYTSIKRDVQKGILKPVYKGLYSSIPLAQLDPLELGKAVIHRYTYLSTETVLAQAGVIFQPVYSYTFVSDISHKASVGPWSFLYRKLKPEYLFHPDGLIEQNGVFQATVERAAADMLYFNPKYHFDNPGNIDFRKVNFLRKEIGYR
jgi:hypothetical protein